MNVYLFHIYVKVLNILKNYSKTKHVFNVNGLSINTYSMSNIHVTHSKIGNRPHMQSWLLLNKKAANDPMFPFTISIWI